jgi:hypothetical protein
MRGCCGAVGLPLNRDSLYVLTALNALEAQECHTVTPRPISANCDMSVT